MGFYSDAIVDADSLIREFGQTLTLKLYGNSTFDPVTETHTRTSSTVSVVGVIFPTNQNNVDEVNVRFGDLEVYVSAADLSADIKAGDELTDVNGVTYRVVAPEPIRPAGITVFWRMFARRINPNE